MGLVCRRCCHNLLAPFTLSLRTAGGLSPWPGFRVTLRLSLRHFRWTEASASWSEIRPWMSIGLLMAVRCRFIPISVRPFHSDGVISYRSLAVRCSPEFPLEDFIRKNRWPIYRVRAASKMAQSCRDHPSIYMHSMVGQHGETYIAFLFSEGTPKAQRITARQQERRIMPHKLTDR